MNEVHIVNDPPDQETLRKLWKNSGLELDKFFNSRGKVYRDLGLKDKLADMDEEEKLALLASDGKLIKRPIVTDGYKVTLGFKEQQFAEEWGK